MAKEVPVSSCITVPKGNYPKLYGFDKIENDTNFALAKAK